MRLEPSTITQIKNNTQTSPQLSNFYTIIFYNFKLILEKIDKLTSSSIEINQILSVQQFDLTLEFPSIYKTMLQPMKRPNNKLKRIKCGMNCTNVKFKLHEKYTNIFITAYSHIYGGINNGYRKWQQLLQENLNRIWENQQPSPHECQEYMRLYQNYRKNLLVSKNSKNQQLLLLELVEKERHFSLSTIMSLRRQVCQWKFDQQQIEGKPKSPISIQLQPYNRSNDPYDHDYIQDKLMMAWITFQKPFYDDLWAPLREIQLYSRNIEKLNIELYSETNMLYLTLTAERAKFSTSLLLCQNPEYPYGSIGATDDICEPVFPWFQCDAGMSNFNISIHHYHHHHHMSKDLFSHPLVFLETQHGFRVDDIEKWQGNIDFTRESTGSMTLRVECRDTVFNGVMNKEIMDIITIFNNILYKVILSIPEVSVTQYFPQNFVSPDNENNTLTNSLINDQQQITLSYDKIPNYSYLYLQNLKFACVADFSNVIILFPDFYNLSKDDELLLFHTTELIEPLTFQSLAMRADLTLRVLGGQYKESFDFSLYHMEWGLLNCLYQPFNSVIYGHYQSDIVKTNLDQINSHININPTPIYNNNNNNFSTATSMIETMSSFINLSNLTINYNVQVDDCSLQERKYQDLKYMIAEVSGKMKSRICIKIDKISLVEFTNGHLIPLISSPALDVRIKSVTNDIKLAPTCYFQSSNKSTRYPIFTECAQFLVDDVESYPIDTSLKIKPFTYLLEILLSDDQKKNRELVAWCQLSMTSETSGSWNQYPLIEKHTRSEIGYLRYIIFFLLFF